jgi:tetratricopeptide (TPR) repeat protein
LQHTPEKYAQTKNRHYRYFTAFLLQRVDDLKSGSQLDAVRLISADIDNVRSAWQWAIDAKDRVALERAAECLYLYSEIGGALVEGETAFRQAVDAFNLDQAELTAAETSLKGFLLVGQGSLRAHRGDLEGGQALLEQGLAFLVPDNNESHHLRKRAFALMRLGWVLFLQAKNAEAEPVIGESLDLYTEIGDRWGMAKSLSLLGNNLTGSGRLAEAENPLRRSLAICQDIGDRRSQLLVDWNLAILTFWFGEYVQTEQLLTDAVMLGQEFDDQIGLAFALKEIGKLEVAQGKYSQAIQTFQESIAITDEIGSHWESAATLEDLSLAHCRIGDYAAAENVLRQCLEASQARQHHYFIARCVGDLGLLAYYKEHYQQAEQHLQNALDIWKDLGHEPYIAWVQCQLGHVLQAMGQQRYAESGQHYVQALQLSVAHKLAPIVMDVFIGVAGLNLQIDNKQKALNLLILIESHPASTAETRKSARKYLADLDFDQFADSGEVDTGLQLQEWQVTAAELVDVIVKANW